MKTIGILNLTRFGDLVQTSPVLTGLRKRHPDTRIHLIVKTRFRQIAEMLPGVDVIHEIDGDALARALADPTSSFIDAYHEVRDVVDALSETSFEVVYNLTHSRASAVLLSLLETEERVGYTIDREGLRHVENPWLAHMATLVRARRLSRFNLVDMYLGAAGLLGCGEPLSVHISHRARVFAEAQLPAASVSSGRGVRRLALQLGASSDAKTWPVDRFAATLRALSAAIDGLQVVLVGVPDEARGAEALLSMCPGVSFQNLVGATGIAELAAVLERCDLLLTGDTGTMHLAGAVGTRTCAVFVGLGTPWETSVYAEGHLAMMSTIGCAPCAHHVRCGFPVCHEDIPTDWLADLLARSLRGEDVAATPALQRAELLRTRFDEDGLLDLIPVHARPPGSNDLLGLAWRAVFLERLAGIRVDERRIRRHAEQRYGLAADEWSRVLPSTLPQELGRLESLGERAMRLALDLGRAGGDAARIRRCGEQLAACDEAIYEISRGEPLLAPMGLSLEGGLHGLPESDLNGLAMTSARHYEAVARGARVIRELHTPNPEVPPGGTSR